MNEPMFIYPEDTLDKRYSSQKDYSIGCSGNCSGIADSDQHKPKTFSDDKAKETGLIFNEEM